VAGGVTLPTYIPFTGVAPDVPASGHIPPGFTAMPKQLVKTVAETPGRGGTVSIVTETLGITPRPPDQNRLWQEVNKQLGVNLQITVVPFADYAAKINTIIAGDDLPDLLFFQIATGGPPIPNIPRFLEAKCADLTPYLSGDAVKEYPNLANHPTISWRNVIFNGKIFGVSDPNSQFFWVHWMHQELLEQAGSGPPSSAADYKRIMQATQDPSRAVWGVVVESGPQYGGGVMNGLFSGIFGAPNNWALANGKLTRSFETEQFKAATGYARDLWAAGLYEPGSTGYNTLSARQAFQNRRGVFRWDGNVPDTFNAGAQLNPPGKVRLVPPFPAEPGGKPAYFLFNGSFGMIVLKKASDERIKELLRILNYIAAPFGSQERLLLNYGVEGYSYTLDERGNPTLTEAGRLDTMPWNTVCNPAPFYYDPSGSDYVKHITSAFKDYDAVGIEDPTVGHYSPLAARQGVTAFQKFGDGITDIVVGRRQLSDYDQLLKTYLSEAGDQLRHDYEESIAKTG
jgi:putative aldouronate transport system substrate-binding protein